MPYSAPSTSVEVTGSGFPSGLVGTIGVRLTDGQGGSTVARTTAGITEFPEGSGIYNKVLTAPSVQGQYLIVWDTGGASPQFGVDELIVTFDAPGPPSTDLECSVQDVASLLRARTKDDSGNEVGDFNANTRPTDSEVRDLISQAASMVSAVANADVPTRLYQFGQHVVALRSAMMVELTYWPEQVQRENSPFQYLQSMFLEALAEFKTALGDSEGIRGYGPVCVKITSPLAASDNDE